MSETQSHEPSVETMIEIWQNHTMSEFGLRDADVSVTTLTDDSHVLLVPIQVGANGKEAVRAFYARSFLPQIPADMEAVPVSRTVGQGQLVDEAIYRFTHSIQMDWFLPGVPATGRKVEFVLVAVIRFRGDLICSEHLYWDHATVLTQLGLLDAAATAGGVRGASSAQQLAAWSAPKG